MNTSSIDQDIDLPSVSINEKLKEVSNLRDLEQFEKSVFSKNGELSLLSRKLGGLSQHERKSAGEKLNKVRSFIKDKIFSSKRAFEEEARANRLIEERLDLTEILGSSDSGHVHLTAQTRQELEDVFLGMGFSAAEGPEIEDDWHNFEALNFPPGHPARSSWDTFHVELGEPEQVLLRTHTSPVQIRLMESSKPPIYSVMPGQCFRRETPDARHLAIFNQIEGLVVDKGITFGDLAGCIETFTEAYFGKGIHSRLRPAFFPFTEPSAEFEVQCFFCNGNGCRTCSHTGWIELGGCGMVDPNVLKAVDIDPEEYSGFAFGFGIERCAQLHHDISDARVLLDNDIRFLSQF